MSKLELSEFLVHARTIHLILVQLGVEAIEVIMECSKCVEAGGAWSSSVQLVKLSGTIELQCSSMVERMCVQSLHAAP